jgi:hypothetical protein
MLRFRAIVVGAILVGWMFAAPVAARQMQAPGSRIVLDLDEVWTPAPNFSGFIYQRANASILINEFPPEAFAQISTGMTPAKLAERFQNVEIIRLDRPDDHVFVTADQATAMGVFAKFLLVLKGEATTALVTVTVPRDRISASGPLSRAALADMLTRATVAASAAPAAAPIVTVTNPGPFKEAGVFAGQSRIYTLDGQMGPDTAGKPVLVIAPSLDRRATAMSNQDAARMLSTTAGVRDVTLSPATSAVIDGRNTVVTQARAVDAKTGTPMLLHQFVVLRRGGGYVRVVAILPASDREQLVPAVVTLAESMKIAD